MFRLHLHCAAQDFLARKDAHCAPARRVYQTVGVNALIDPQKPINSAAGASPRPRNGYCPFPTYKNLLRRGDSRIARKIPSKPTGATCKRPTVQCQSVAGRRGRRPLRYDVHPRAGVDFSENGHPFVYFNKVRRGAGLHRRPAPRLTYKFCF